MDNLNIFDADVSKWSKPINIYTDGVVKSMARDVRKALNDSSTSEDDIYRVIPFGSQYFDNAIFATTALDMYILNTENYFYDIADGIDKSKLELPQNSIDYKKYRKSIYKLMGDYFKKSNISLGNISISIKKEHYRVNIVPVYSHRSYQNVIDKEGNTIVSFVEGVTFFDKSGKQVINYPTHEEKNYHITNLKTDYRFNAIVRFFKNLSYWISRKEGYSVLAHSYLITSLIYNVPNVILKRMSGYDGSVLEITDYLYDVLTTDLYKDMYEINDIKLLFSSKQKWSLNTALNLIAKYRQYAKYIV